jgi:hypothetical protein
VNGGKNAGKRGLAALRSGWASRASLVKSGGAPGVYIGGIV